MIWSTIIFILLGTLLGLEKLLLEMRTEGKWRINLPKVILLGIPSLYFSFGIVVMYYCPIAFIQQTLGYPIQFFLQSEFNFLSIFQIILGYIIVTSFIKIEE